MNMRRGAAPLSAPIPMIEHLDFNHREPPSFEEFG